MAPTHILHHSAGGLSTVSYRVLRFQTILQKTAYLLWNPSLVFVSSPMAHLRLERPQTMAVFMASLISNCRPRDHRLVRNLIDRDGFATIT